MSHTAGPPRRPHSLRGKMLSLMLVFWLLPVVLILVTMGIYIQQNLSQRANDDLETSLRSSLQNSVDRMDTAVAAARRPSYDHSLERAYQAYLDQQINWVGLYSNSISYLNSQYLADPRFPAVALWYHQDPLQMRVGMFNSNSPATQRELRQFWERHWTAVKEMADTLDTQLGFCYLDGRLYLVRNLVDARFRPFATLVLELKPAFFFSELGSVAWGQSMSLWLEDEEIVLKGAPPRVDTATLAQGATRSPDGDTRYCFATQEGEGYALSALIQVDDSALLGELRGYRSILVLLALLLWPMLLIFFRLYDRNVTRPIQALTQGAEQVNQGALGHQVQQTVHTREFRYLLDSFNQMSGRLQSQFHRIYQEELSLRDARIHALQSQINPHFLNNTLEIINWEARLEGNMKVSRMIESLSTLLDAAMDRHRKPEVRLAEELHYVNAYLYIIDQRFGKRLEVVQDIAPDTMDCLLPRLVLQPIIENAVDHGIGPGGHGRVAVRSRLAEDVLIVEIENDGHLTPDDEILIAKLLSPDYDASRETSANIGIANVNQRLRILYGPPSGLSLGREDGDRVVARLSVAQSRAAHPSDPPPQRQSTAPAHLV